MTNQEDIKKINDVLKQADGVDAAFIYGSVASGEAKESSDIDIAYFCSESKKVSKQDIIEELLTKVKNDIDVLNLNDSNPTLAVQVLKNNIELFNKKPKNFEKWRIATLNKYWDLQISNREIYKNLGKHKVITKD